MAQFLSSAGCCAEDCDCCGGALAALTAAVRLPGDRWPAACCLAYAMASLGTYEIRAAAPAPGPYDRRAGSRYTDRSSSSLPELDEHVEQQPCSAAESSSKSGPPVATFAGGGIGAGGGSLFRPPLRLRLRLLFRPFRRRRRVRPEADNSADDDAAVPSNRTDRRPPAVISGVDDDDDARCWCNCSGAVPGGAAGGRRHDEDDGVGGYVSADAVTASGGGGGGGGGGAAAVSFSNSVSNRSVMSSSETSFSRKL